MDEKSGDAGDDQGSGWLQVKKVAEGARLCGAKRIIGVDINQEKFELGKKFGVTDFVSSRNCGDKSVSQVIMEMTDGGADYCFECAGMSSLVHEAYASCRKVYSISYHSLYIWQFKRCKRWIPSLTCIEGVKSMEWATVSIADELG
ncbi:putative alcohol dehydrogenase [Helianthus anomalus]